MIDDALERQQAILLLLGDVAPDLTAVEIPGYILAIEAQLEVIQAQELADAGRPCPPQYAGKGGPAELMKDMATVAAVRDAARGGSLTKTAKAILAVEPGVGSGRAFGAARSIINMLDDDPGWSSTL